MKLLLLKSAPLLTKAGKPRKRGPLRGPTRLFTEDGREFEGLVNIEWSVEPQYQSVSYRSIGERSKDAATLGVREIIITLSYPDIELIAEPPQLRA